jgi:hypothetical protein
MLILLYLYACGSKKNTDSYTLSSEPIAQIEEISEKLKGVQTDGLFDDFIYQFISDSLFQRQRILFPLPYNKLDSSSKIEQADWQHDDLFAKESLYTLFFDKEEDMELSKDTSLTSVQVEWIFPENHTIKKYDFKRTRQSWYLRGIELIAIEKEERISFTDFFFRFCNDSVFQYEHIKKPLTFITNDPDDDFSIIKTTLGLDQWAVFKPEFPDKLSNIDYGQRYNNKGGKKIVALKGIGNGFSSILYFQRKEDRWDLYKFEDVSN